jgi:hypothetical protein
VFTSLLLWGMSSLADGACNTNVRYELTVRLPAARDGHAVRDGQQCVSEEQ